jgi:peptide/nickel transport system substrate-binding protein
MSYPSSIPGSAESGTARSRGSRCGRWAGALVAGLIAAWGGAPTPAAAEPASLQIGLPQEPETLDPTLSRTFTERLVLTQLCERLYDLDTTGEPVPQLAAGLPEATEGGRVQLIRLMPNLRFNDGTPFDAQAVKVSLERHLTLGDSLRRSELGPLASIEVAGPLAVRLKLDRPFAPLLVALADRAGMILSPAQISRRGESAISDPVCVGPWQFDDRVAGERLVFQRSPFYSGAKTSNVQRLVFRPIPDSGRRLAALRNGEVQLIISVPPSEIENLRKDSRFEIVQVLGPGYVGITINIANRTGRQAGAANLGTPWAKLPKVREALDLSLDRSALNQSALGGEYVPGCTPISPGVPIHPAEMKCPPRDVARAKQLLADEGYPGGLSLDLTIMDDPVQRRIGEAIQSMVREAGIQVRLKPASFREVLSQQERGQFEALLLGYAGRLDPDSVIFPFHTCRGTFNFSLSCDPALDRLLHEAQEKQLPAARLQLYGEAIDRLGQIRSIIYLFHQKYSIAFSRRVTGVKYAPDGLPRLAEVRLESHPPATSRRGAAVRPERPAHRM